MERRRFLKVLGGAMAAFSTAPLMRAVASDKVSQDDFYVFVHAFGGWDITLSLDPQVTRTSAIEPPHTGNTNSNGIRYWTNRALDGASFTFEPIRPAGTSLVLGPGVGALAELGSRLTVINGINMSTVDHNDGAIFSATGRHSAASRPVVSSIDTIVAHETGREMLFPLASASFPSFLVGSALDARVSPLQLSSFASVSDALTRSDAYDGALDRDAVNAVLSDEALDLASKQPWYDGMRGQLGTLRKMHATGVRSLFDPASLRAKHPELPYDAPYHGDTCITAAFALEAMRQNLARCVSFRFLNFDTHFTDYAEQARLQQCMFDALAAMVRSLDATPHPTLAGHKLSEHTHILVVSEFGRTPLVNPSRGRDHHPCNSALVISPRFRGGARVGSSDPEQMLATDRTFSDGARSITPADVLATFLAAQKIDPRAHLRDGEPLTEVLA
jgi:hypothetical protein